MYQIAYLSFLSLLYAYPNCISDNGNNVDIWALFKGPDGTRYNYWDSYNPLDISIYDMNSTNNGALGSTVSQLWIESTEYIIWNDSPPNSESYNFTVGHSKGIWAWNIETGDAIIIQHSIPEFPKGPAQSLNYTGLGNNAWEYGQHATCFHTTVSELNRIASYAFRIVLNIYDLRTSSKTPSNLAQLANGIISEDPVCNSDIFHTIAGESILFYTKSMQWNNELYANCLTSGLQTSLYVESWIHGDAEGPACNQYSVYDIAQISYPNGPDFNEYNDHSKWAIGGAWFCASDINRMTSQYLRGGSAYCFNPKSLILSLENAIKTTESC
jgi:hypothetical protein